MEATTNATQQLATMAIQILALILLPLAGLLARRLVMVFEAKTKIDVSQRTEAQIDEWAHQAIDLAEEKAHKAAKTGLAKVTGPEKIELAADYVLDLIKKYELDKKVGEWSRAKVKDLVEARIPDSSSKARVPNGAPEGAEIEVTTTRTTERAR